MNNNKRKLNQYMFLNIQILQEKVRKKILLKYNNNNKFLIFKTI